MVALPMHVFIVGMSNRTVTARQVPRGNSDVIARGYVAPIPELPT